MFRDRGFDASGDHNCTELVIAGKSQMTARG